MNALAIIALLLVVVAALSFVITNKSNLSETETINEKQKIIVKKIRENLETILSIISK